MKMAILGTLIVAIFSAHALADDLTELKSEIDTIHDRIISLEAVPAETGGSQNQIPDATDISIIMPLTNNIAACANDCPSSTAIPWQPSGPVKVILPSRNDSSRQEQYKIKPRASKLQTKRLKRGKKRATPS